MSLTDKVQRVNFKALEFRPNDLRFVQFYVDNEPYLRLSRSGHPWIIEAFLRECKECEGESIVDPTEYSDAMRKNHGNPPIKVGRYEAVGFGFISMPRSKRVKLIDFSSTYNIGPNREHLQRLSEHFTDWTLEI